MRSKRARVSCLSLGLLLLAPSARAAEEPASAIDYEKARFERRLLLQRTNGPIALDGDLGEPAWKDAPVARHFIQSEPSEGERATFDTEVRILYDDANLYLGVTAFDGEPERIVVNDLSRDFNARSGDAFAVVLDTFHDNRNGYMFETNPRGAKFDAQFFNEGDDFNLDWDGVWHVAARVIDGGWSAEMAIPFKTLRFDEASGQIWGLNFLRRIRRLNEDSFWSPIPRIHRITRVSLAGTLEDIRGLRPGANVKLTPFVTANASKTPPARAEGDAEVGLDAKLGIGTGLALDLTLNTDFSQVEADLQQVNLTRFPLFFPEKRDFFLENAGMFRFGPPTDPRLAQFQASFGQLGGGGALRGGQARGDDLLLFFSRRIGLSDLGLPIPVIGGGRLTGYLGAYELGFLNIQTGAEEGLSTGDNFTVLRLKRKIFANSDVGAMFVDKESMDSNHFNRSFGADANFRLTPQIDVNSYIAKTSTPGREGDDLAGRLAFSYQGRRLELRTAISALQENFNPEVGFAPRVGVRRGSSYAGYHYRQSWGRRALREIHPHGELEYFTDPQGNVVSRYFNVHVDLQLQNGGIVEGGINTNLERVPLPFPIHPTTTIAPGLYSFDDYFVMVFTDPSRALSGNGRLSAGDFYSGTRRAVDLGGVLKLSGELTAEVGWSRNDIDLAEGSFITDLLSTRFLYAFSTRMFLNGLVQYNSIFDEWNSNIRFRFIYRPLSDIYLVYNERRGGDGGLRDRALIAKFTYLFDF